DNHVLRGWRRARARARRATFALFVFPAAGWNPTTFNPRDASSFPLMRLPLLPAFLPLAPSALAQSGQQLPDFPGTARDDATAFSIGGKVYVGTGMEVGWGLTNDWWCYDAGTGNWEAMPAMPASPRQ